jgi:site-specific recombinase
VGPKNRHHFRPGEKGQAAEELRRLLVVLEDEKRLFLRRVKVLDEEIAWVRQRLVFVQTGSEKPDEGGSHVD